MRCHAFTRCKVPPLQCGLGIQVQPIAIHLGGFQLLQHAARPLRYMDRYVYVTQGEVFYITEALANPTAHARWLWVSTDDSDAVRQALAGSTELRSAYRLAHSQPGVDLYRRIEA